MKKIILIYEYGYSYISIILDVAHENYKSTGII